MAEAHLSVGVEVSLRPDERTSAWLESLGWIRPGAPSTEIVTSELDTEEDEDWDPIPVDIGTDLGVAAPVKIPMDLRPEGIGPFDTPCGHTEAGTVCDWNVCLQPAVQCTAMYAVNHGKDATQCRREKGHKGVHVSVKDNEPWCHWSEGDPRQIVLTAQPVKALNGVEAQRYRARQLRTRLRGELADESAQKDLDELLRLCDVDMKTVFGSDCDC